MRKHWIGLALICTLLLATGTLAYITPIDSWNLRDYYDIIAVNEINGSTANFTTYEDAEGNSVTDFSTLGNDTNASTACSGSTTYLDGEGNCDDISGVYVQAADWTTIDSYPAACAAGNAVQTIADTLTCIDTIANATLWADYAIGGNQIQSADIGDVDDIDVEADLNTYVDIAGDVMTGALNMTDDLQMGQSEVDSYIYFYEGGSPTGEFIRWDNTYDTFWFSDRIDAEEGKFYNFLSCDADIYTIGSGDDLWLGDTTQLDAHFQAYADGSLNISSGAFIVNASGSITEVVSIHLDDNEAVVFGTDWDTLMYDDGTNFIIERV